MLMCLLWEVYKKNVVSSMAVILHTPRYANLELEKNTVLKINSEITSKSDVIFKERIVGL